MISFLLSWIPLLVAILVAISKIKRKRVALPLIILAYVIAAIVLILVAHALPAYNEMIESGVGDPQLLAGEISVAIVTAMLRAIIDIPIAILVFFGVRKWRQKRA